MRLDLSKEQLFGVISSLKSNINALEKEMLINNLDGIAEDIVKESITIKKSTLLYLVDLVTR